MRHPTAPLAALALVLAASGARADPPAAAPAAVRPGAPAFTTLVVGALARIEVEPALYERPGSAHFFGRVRVVNLASRPLGVDLDSSRWRTLYPNQWGRGDEATRGAIDERRATVAPLTAADQAALRAMLHRGALAVVPARGALDYYAEFNASGRAEVAARPGRYVIVSMAGELRLTDGARVEQLAFDFSPRAPQSTDVTVPAPVAWRAIPVGARVVTSP